MCTRSSDPTSTGLSVIAASVLTAAGVALTPGSTWITAMFLPTPRQAMWCCLGSMLQPETLLQPHLPSMLAFILGLISSRLTGAWLKKAGLNSRNVRLASECILLVALASIAGHLRNGVVTACVGFIAAVQITSFSHIGEMTFNTGMTTGNLRGAFSAASAAWYDPAAKEDRARAFTFGLMCLAFAAGAVLGGFCTMCFGDKTLFIAAGMVGFATLLMWRTPDPGSS
jgi:uncharacterized membrane protein YoaK (UPF0700 family)